MTTIVMAGCGALGSQIAMHLSHPDLYFVLIDDDTVEEHNLLTTHFLYDHVGLYKVYALGDMLYRNGLAASIAHNEQLTSRNVNKLFFGADLIVDTFDNGPARSLCAMAANNTPVIHAGVSQALTGAVQWQSNGYVPPGNEFARGQNMVCTRELGRDILRMTATVTANAISNWLSTSVENDYLVLPLGVFQI